MGIQRYELRLNTMREFLENYPNRVPFTRQVSMGKKSVDAVALAIEEAGLPFTNE